MDGNVTKKTCQRHDQGANVKRLVGSTAIALIALTGCSGVQKDTSTPVPSASASSGASATSGACTSETAKPVTRAFIQPKAFDPACAKAKRGSQFVFGNLDTKAHTVRAAKGAPQHFEAELPHKNSLFSVKLAKEGTYRVETADGLAMTLLVTQ
jgi:plastocyanin